MKRPSWIIDVDNMKPNDIGLFRIVYNKVYVGLSAFPTHRRFPRINIKVSRNLAKTSTLFSIRVNGYMLSIQKEFLPIYKFHRGKLIYGFIFLFFKIIIPKKVKD